MQIRIGVAMWLMLAGTLGAEPVRVDIDTDGSLGTINPAVYGQFVEHLGRGIYGSLWVGEDSATPNQDGYRLDVLNALKDLDVTLLRWPGGCFADRYHWRDGIGSAEDRVARLNSSWGGVLEPNTFGTHEFFNLAELLGAKTYLNFNLGTGTPQEAVDWLEYITSDSESSLANERRQNGRDKPWQVDYYSIGNETWGCGGHMSPERYGELYAQYASFLGVPGQSPKRIVSGSHDSNIDYSKRILRNEAVVNLSEGISVHYYTLPTGDWGDKGAAVDFPEAEWFSTVRNTLRMSDIIDEQLAMIDALDSDKEYKLYVDEWGMWTNPAPGTAASALYQQNTIRDAVVAALNLNLFHAHAERIETANIAQMINVLQAMILTDDEQAVLTPTYHVFHLYRDFQGATSLPVSFEAPQYRNGDQSVPALSVSAGRNSDGEIFLALVNADAQQEVVVQPVTGGNPQSFSGRQLSADAMDAHNSFAAPGKVAPRTVRGKLGGSQGITLPPRSITVVRLE